MVKSIRIRRWLSAAFKSALANVFFETFGCQSFKYVFDKVMRCLFGWSACFMEFERGDIGEHFFFRLPIRWICLFRRMLIAFSSTIFHIGFLDSCFIKSLEIDWLTASTWFCAVVSLNRVPKISQSRALSKYSSGFWMPSFLSSGWRKNVRNDRFARFRMMRWKALVFVASPGLVPYHIFFRLS